jgi:hypothetical protein
MFRLLRIEGYVIINLLAVVGDPTQLGFPRSEIKNYNAGAQEDSTKASQCKIRNVKQLVYIQTAICGKEITVFVLQ